MLREHLQLVTLKKVLLLIERTKQSFFEGLKYCREGYRVGDISHAVQEYAESFGYGVVKPLTGHGIGHNMHQDPDVPNYGRAGRGTCRSEILFHGI